MKRRDNGAYKIDKDIPVPPRKGRGSLMALMRTMKVGESVFVPNQKTGNHTAWLVFGKGNYTTRVEKAGVRVWRIK
jgi:hypothetical protein